MAQDSNPAPALADIRKYSGKYAREYEATRQGPMWEAEGRAFQHLFRRVAPRRVLDCPIGTGRWFETYRQQGASVVGVDLSRDMLDEAAKKVWPGASVQLRQANLLDPHPPDLGTGYDLIVCTRYLHLVRRRSIPVVISRLSETRSRFLLIGASVRSEGRLRDGIRRLRRIVRRLRGQSAQARVHHVHNESALLRDLQAGGWHLVEKQRIGGDGVGNYFYLLRSSTDL